MKTKICLFVGPTLFREPTPAGIVRYGPAALGSVFRAVEAGYRRIGVVDGFFGNAPSVWHKEILYAISRGVDVAGAGSMGALRAAELWTLGMVGCGRIFRLFRSGAWTDDDEVAVIHATKELDFQPVSEAMANVRFTLRSLTRKGVLERRLEQEIVRRMKAFHFSGRTKEALRQQLIELVGRAKGEEVVDRFEREFVDAKRQDARALVRYLTGPRAKPWPRASKVFSPTDHWRGQFETEIADVPPLG